MPNIIVLAQRVLAILPFMLLCFASKKVNIKKTRRSRQFSLPLVSTVYSIIIIIFINKINRLILWLVDALPNLIATKLPEVGVLIENILSKINWTYGIFYVSNTLIITAYLLLKMGIISGLHFSRNKGNRLHDSIAGTFYEYYEEKSVWVLQNRYGQAKTFFQFCYYGSVVISCVVFIMTRFLMEKQRISVPFYPVIGVLILGEIYFFFDGLTKREYHNDVLGEDEDSLTKANYSILRNILRALFGDRVLAEDTRAQTSSYQITQDEIFEPLLLSSETNEQIFGQFLEAVSHAGLSLNSDYVKSTLELMHGKSVMFSNPFYRDMAPYIFYPMNRCLIQHQKILVVLGRHAIEKDIMEWLIEGFTQITNIPTLWDVEKLDERPCNANIGIITRSNVHNLKMLNANKSFFAETRFVLIIEPSKLIATAQVGLNLIVKSCKAKKDDVVFCSCDRNCDGLLDSLSHILMTSITDVSATGTFQGTNSAMYWGADGDYLHHRITPNIARYMGVGTELAAVALHNQVSSTIWYGGEKFPVNDMRWIVGQYYSTISDYASIPKQQDELAQKLSVSYNFWDAKVKNNNYMVVEDEFYNMFEVSRHFSTRATEQGFVNVLASNYLLREYMAQNYKIFETDAKALPTITADYARTERNVILRLLIMLASNKMPEKDLINEFKLIGCGYKDLKCALSEKIREYFDWQGDSEIIRSETVSVLSDDVFDTFKIVQETYYYIDDSEFISKYVHDLKNADYIAEDEKGEKYFLGSELMGHVYQRYLPGQFFVFSGKYYEVVSISSDFSVLVRRAADHLDKRYYYRQFREYSLNNIVVSTIMGDQKDISGIKIVKEFADISVETPAYLAMNNYNDIYNAKKVTINGIPDRRYTNKSILRIELPDTEQRINTTICTLFNESFKTLFPENYEFICAVTSSAEKNEEDAFDNMEAELEVESEAEAEAGASTIGTSQSFRTYSLAGDVKDNAIYIIEDSQLDLGLIVAVERNLKRLFEIACDYLVWHRETLEKSLASPQVEETPCVVPLDKDDPNNENVVSWFKKAIKKIKAFFKKKPKDDLSPDGEENGGVGSSDGENPPVENPELDEASSSDENMVDDIEEDLGDSTEEADSPSTEVAVPGSPLPLDENSAPLGITPVDKDDSSFVDISSSGKELGEKDEENGVLFSTRYSRLKFFDQKPVLPIKNISSQNEQDQSFDENGNIDQFGAEASAADSTDEEATPVDEEQVDVLSGEDQNEDNTDSSTEEMEIDGEDEERYRPIPITTKRPYHECYYLLFGGTELSVSLDIDKTIGLLTKFGFDKNPLKQARDGLDIAKHIEETYNPAKADSRFCDFCGIELLGIEYEVLADGRERCSQCGRSAVKTTEEFTKIFKETLRNMEAFYGINIHVGMKVRMTTAKKIAKRLKKQFTATKGFDARAVGVAIKDGDGYTILVENGAPRISVIMTIAHELTHIWQYLNWDDKKIILKYGKSNRLEVYEGMAKWGEIQYAMLINEIEIAKREEIVTRMRDDEYGKGFCRYIAKYPFSEGSYITKATPYMDKNNPL